MCGEGGGGHSDQRWRAVTKESAESLDWTPLFFRLEGPIAKAPNATRPQQVTAHPSASLSTFLRCLRFKMSGFVGAPEPVRPVQLSSSRVSGCRRNDCGSSSFSLRCAPHPTPGSISVPRPCWRSPSHACCFARLSGFKLFALSVSPQPVLPQ